MNMGENNKIELTYGDIVLRASDVELLHGSHWLNDTVIEFWFEYLSKCVYQENEDCLFVGPGVTHCLKASETVKEMALFLDPLAAKNKKIIFFVLNDNRMYGECNGGTHWSLLAYSKQDQFIGHYDSLAIGNLRQAAQLSRKLWKYFLNDGKGDFDGVTCLQQENNYDCGIFVLCHAEHLMNHFLKNASFIGCEKLETTETEHKRSDILCVINSLKMDN